MDYVTKSQIVGSLLGWCPNVGWICWLVVGDCEFGISMWEPTGTMLIFGIYGVPG